MLRSNGIDNLVPCTDSREAMAILRGGEFELVLLDLTMPHLPGDKLLAAIHEEMPQVPVIVVTGSNEVSSAVECMKAGAFDYMVKAVEESRLVSGVRRAIEIRKLSRDYRRLKEGMLCPSLAHPDAFARLVTGNAVMISIFRIVESIAKSDEPILITGETGTGKGLVAAAVHAASGREGPLVEVDVAGLDDAMFSDTLFGHRKGAYTGAVDARAGLVQQAGAGTLFLDEIGDLSIQSQVKLLRLLDTGEYYPLGSDLPRRAAARVLVATNRNLVRAHLRRKVPQGPVLPPLDARAAGAAPAGQEGRPAAPARPFPRGGLREARKEDNPPCRRSSWACSQRTTSPATCGSCAPWCTTRSPDSPPRPSPSRSSRRASTARLPSSRAKPPLPFLHSPRSCPPLTRPPTCWSTRP